MVLRNNCIGIVSRPNKERADHQSFLPDKPDELQAAYAMSDKDLWCRLFPTLPTSLPSSQTSISPA